MPFRKLLSPKEPFVWMQELNDAFEKAKLNIVDEVKGLMAYNMERVAVLNTDWSKIRIFGCSSPKVLFL